LLHYSITPTLHYFITPSLHHSNTPLFNPQSPIRNPKSPSMNLYRHTTVRCREPLANRWKPI
ncbi:MAG: hypothetical protein AAB209_14310, partial [Bacteroidota bacterium]